MAERHNPLLQVTVDGTVYPFDLDALNGRQMGQIEKWCALTAADLVDGIQTAKIGAASAAVFLSVDQATGPLDTDAAIVAMELVSVHSDVEFEYAPVDEPAPVPKKAPAKKAPAKKKAAPRSTPAGRKATA